MTTHELIGDRDRRNVCIICESAKQPRSRGLCQMHYRRYVRKRESLPEDERAGYDEYLIFRGLLLPSRQGGRTTPVDEFEDAYNEMKRFNVVAPDYSDDVVNDVVKEAVEKIELEVENSKPSSKSPDEQNGDTKPQPKK